MNEVIDFSYQALDWQPAYSLFQHIINQLSCIKINLFFERKPILIHFLLYFYYRHNQHYFNICAGKPNQNINYSIKFLIKILQKEEEEMKLKQVSYNSYTEKKQNWFVSPLVKLSYALENITIKSRSLILAFFLTQTILDVIFPCFVLISDQDNRIDVIETISKKLFSWSYQGENLISYMFVSQVLLSLLLIATFVALVALKNEKSKLIALFFTKFFFCFSSLILYLSTQSLLSFISDQLKSSRSILGLLLCFTNILLELFFCILYKILAHSYSSLVPNTLCCRFQCFSIARSITIKIVAGLIFLVMKIKILWPESAENTDIVYKLSVFLLFATVLSQLKTQVQYFTYASPATSKIYRACLILQVSCIFNTLLCLTTGLELLYNNYLFAICSLYVFSYMAITAYLGSRSQNFHLKSQQQITSQEEAILLIVELNKIFQVEYIKSADLTQLFMIKNLYKKHEEDCLVVECYCKDKLIDRSNVESMINLYRLVTLSLMERYCQKYSDSFQVTKFVLSAKLHVHRNFVGISRLSPKMKNQEKLFSQVLFFKKYHLELSEYLGSTSNVLNLAETEKCLQSVTLNEVMLKKISKMIQLRYRFWSKLNKGTINQQFELKIEQQLTLLKQLFCLVQTIIDKFYNNLFLINLSIGYQKSILMKDKITKQLLACIDKFQISHMKRIKIGTKLTKKQNIQEMMYENSSCTIEVSMEQINIGKIVNASRNVFDVFGLHEKDLIGHNINMLMPKTMQDQHDILIRKWSQKCSWANMGQLRSIFCMNKDNICFSSKMYLKPVLRVDCVNLIGCFFKENDQDYMVVDNEDKIVAAGNSFLKMLGPKIINLPLDFIIENTTQLKTWATFPDKIFHTLTFHSIKSKMQLQQGEKQSKPITSTKKLIKQQIEANKNQAQWYNLKFSISEMNVGRIKFKIIKLEGARQTKKNTHKQLQSLKAINERCQKKDQIKTSVDSFNQSNMFLNFNPSISSSSCQQPTATHNVIYKMEKIFYAKSQIQDLRSIKIVITVVVLCLLGILLDIGKIYVNEKGFQQMQELFFADGACSDNLQISMFIYNKALILDQKLRAHQQKLQNILNNSQSTEVKLADLNFITDLQNDVAKQEYEQAYLYSLVSEQIKNYNSHRTSLTNMNMFKYENNMVKWVDPSQNQELIQTTRFMVNFMYISQQSAKIALQAINVISKNITIGLKQQSLQKISAKLNNYLNILHSNFAQLEAMNSDNLIFYADLLLQTKSMIKMLSYFKLVGTVLIFFLLLVILNKHHQFRGTQNTKIYEEYRLLTMECVQGLMRYFYQLKIIIKQPNDIRSDQVMKQRNPAFLQFNTQTLFKLNEVNDQYMLRQIRNQNRQASGLKISVQKPNYICLRIFFVLIFLTIVSLNVLMETAESKVLNKSEEIVQYINNLMDSENELIATYFKQKAERISGVDLSRQQLDLLLQKVKKVEVEFTHVAMGSLKLFSKYDPSYMEKMSKILTENVCELTKQDLPLEYYDKCVKDEQMNIITHGVINGMNYFGREVQNLIYKRIKEDEKEKSFNFSLPRVDKTMFHMFKIYQKTQAEITNSLSVVINHQKSQYLLEIVLELMAFIAFVGYMASFYSRENRECVSRIGKILLLPVSVIKNDLKILRNFERIVDYDNISEK